MTRPIPFNRPFLVGAELDNVATSLAHRQLAGDGPFTKRCQQILEERFRAHRALLTTSCTAALEMAALLYDFEPGDEVILPSYTFVSTANAFVLRGARPVFVDVRPDTFNLDERLVAAAITARTRAIVPVHYAGVACEMDAILAIAAQHDLAVIEDAAQGINATYRGRYLGTIGDCGAYSFHESKNIVCGEGGALLVNRPELVERAEILREKGTDRARFFRGEIDKYTWLDVGSSYVPADILAAILEVQLKHAESITAARQRVFAAYHAHLEPLVERGLARLPIIPPDCVANYHMFYLVLADLTTRTALIEHLKRAGIHAVFHYVPLHVAPMGQAFGYRSGMLPVSEAAGERLLRLPLFPDLESGDIARIGAEVCRFFGVTPRHDPAA